MKKIEVSFLLVLALILSSINIVKANRVDINEEYKLYFDETVTFVAEINNIEDRYCERFRNERVNGLADLRIALANDMRGMTGYELAYNTEFMSDVNSLAIELDSAVCPVFVREKLLQINAEIVEIRDDLNSIFETLDENSSTIACDTTMSRIVENRIQAEAADIRALSAFVKNINLGNFDKGNIENELFALMVDVNRASAVLDSAHCITTAPTKPDHLANWFFTNPAGEYQSLVWGRQNDAESYLLRIDLVDSVAGVSKRIYQERVTLSSLRNLRSAGTELYSKNLNPGRFKYDSEYRSLRRLVQLPDGQWYRIRLWAENQFGRSSEARFSIGCNIGHISNYCN